MPESVFTIIGRTVRQLVDEKLDLTGGTLTGNLELLEPTQDSHASTKKYVDDKFAQGGGDIDLSAYARLDGANFTGEIGLQDGNLVGELEHFYGGMLRTDTKIYIPTAEFDAVANNGTVSISGVTSPFSLQIITSSYDNPTELHYDLNKESVEEDSTICTMDMKRATEQAHKHFMEGGHIRIGDSIVFFRNGF